MKRSKHGCVVPVFPSGPVALPRTAAPELVKYSERASKKHEVAETWPCSSSLSHWARSIPQNCSPSWAQVLTATAPKTHGSWKRTKQSCVVPPSLSTGPTALPGSNCAASVQVQCCFTSTETIRTIRNGEPRTATSLFTQLLISEQP